MPTDKELVRAGIPQRFWRIGFTVNAPTVKKLTDDVQAFYNSSSNIKIFGTSESRKKITSWAAQIIMGKDNFYSRGVFGIKHNVPAFLPDGSQISTPFSVKMMDVEGLRDIYQDDDTDFSEKICEPDFFFLTEVGHEWANSFFAKAIVDCLNARKDALLPTIISFVRQPTSILNKDGEAVYSEVTDLVKDWEVWEV